MKSQLEQTKGMTLCPGILLEYYCFNTGKIYRYVQGGSDTNNWTLRIDHCMVGCFSAEFYSGKTEILSSGQYAINSPYSQMRSSQFPDKLYEGISIIVDQNLLTNEILKGLPFLSKYIKGINDWIIEGEIWHIKQSEGLVKEVFAEIYAKLREGDPTYLWIKCVELLHILNGTSQCRMQNYQISRKVNLVKNSFEKMLKSDPRNMVIEKIVKDSGLNTTTYYQVFKSIYGTTPAKYLRNYILNQATIALTTTDKSISDIASEAGYTNFSKFTSAFKQKYNKTPSEFRKTNLILD